MGNSIGKAFTITSFGESHGQGIGVVVDGCPAGLVISEQDIQAEVDRRKPGKGAASTSRTEADRVEIVSGIYDGHTTGAPICLLIRNTDADSRQYLKDRFLPRPGHADFTAYNKYGGFSDFRGGGRFSGRITAGFVMAGAIARKLLKSVTGTEIVAHTVAIGGIKARITDIGEVRANVAKNNLKCGDPKAAEEILRLIDKARAEGDSLGGVIECVALDVPAGLGEPVFDTLEGDLAKALFAIPAVKGIEFGSGFSAAEKKGSENNDPFTLEGNRIISRTNNAGGILGGISNGMPLVLRVAVKPTPSISQDQETVDMEKMTPATLATRGRHDVCIVPRAVPVVEAMVAVTLCDFAIRAGLIPPVVKRSPEVTI